jgi:hypothetical protein
MQASRTYVLWCPMTLSSVWLGNKYECRHKINVIISAQFRKVTWILTMNFHSENLALDYTFPIHFLFNIRASVKDFMGWCMREPYCPLSSAVSNATIPTLPLFEIAEFAYLPFCYALHYLVLFINLFRHFITYMWLDSCCSTVQYSKIVH